MLITNSLVRRWLTDNDATLRLQTAWNEDFQTWVLARLAALEKQAQRLDERVQVDPGAEGRLARLLDDSNS